jgi:hypothetical protein
MATWLRKVTKHFNCCKTTQQEGKQQLCAQHLVACAAGTGSREQQALRTLCWLPSKLYFFILDDDMHHDDDLAIII